MKFTMIRLALSATLVAGALSTVTPAEAAPVTSDDLIKAQDNAAEWLMYGAIIEIGATVPSTRSRRKMPRS